MKVYLPFFAAIIMFFSLPCFSQDSITLKERGASYNQTINTRAEKIVYTIGISDTAKATLVKNIIAEQYKNLNSIYSTRDLQIKTAKESAGNDNKEALNTRLNKIRNEATAKTDVLHKNYISLLSKNFTPKQVDQVKDGMTYGIVQVTYNGYNQMIRRLTDEQKKQILTWLTEAREHAMDAESSEKKHAWFGKYKGRINNYLSAAGYDLKKEGEDWQKRIQQETSKKKIAN